MTLLDRLRDARARRDSAAFAELALRDEATGGRVRLARSHREMHALWQSTDRSVVWAPSEHGKSQNVDAYVAHRVGENPDERVLLLSRTTAQAQRALRAVAIIMHGPDFRRVFPGVTVERLTADELVVTGRTGAAKDATITAGSFDLSSLYGVRAGLVVVDDCVSRDDVRTPAARDRAYADFMAVTASRVAPGGSIHVVNTAEHSDDLPHRLAKLPGWASRSFPALDEQGRPTWPERWPIERIEQRRLELGPVGFRRAMLCQPVDAASVVFPEDDLERALAQGRSEVFSCLGGRSVVAVDPAWTAGASSDESGVVVATIDDDANRHVVHVEGMRVHHDRLVDRVCELSRVHRATVYVESNGAGGVIADAIGKRVPCKALPTTATSKRARVEALSAELASGRWVFRQPLGYPSPELRKLVDELATFNWESHTGDRASALLLATEGARLFEQRPKIRRFSADFLRR